MFAYTMLGFLWPAVYILLFPYYTSKFTELEYGLYNLMLDVGTFAMIIASFRITSAMVTFYYNYAHDRNQLQDYLRSSFSATIVIGLMIVFIFYFLGPILFPIIFKSDKISFFPYGIMMVIYGVLTETGNVYLTYLKNEKDIVKYSALIIIQIFVVVFFQVLLIEVFDLGVFGALLGMVIGWAIVLLSILMLEKGIFTIFINWTMVLSSIKFGIVLIPYLIISWFLMKGGRFFLENYSSLEVVGLYAGIMVLTRLIILGIEAIVNGIRPFMFDQFLLGKKGDKSQIDLFTKMIIIIPLFTIPLIIFAGTNILYFTSNEAYQAMAPYMTFASFTIFMFMYVKLFYQQLVFAKRSDLVTMLSLASFLVLVVGFQYSIPRYQIWGILFSTLLANIVLAILFFFSGQKVMYVKYEFRSILLYPLLIFAIIFGIEWYMLRSGYSYEFFGLVQLVIITLILLIMNGKYLKDYKLLFINKNKS